MMELSALTEFCRESGIDFVCGEPMKNHTSFKIGGAADVFITVCTVAQLSALKRKCKALSVPVFILGSGSNLLVSDKGIDGAVISLSGLNEITVNGEMLTAGAGASLPQVCRAAAAHSLSGLEFAYGIPGSVGGALYMNAGAYGGEIADTVVRAECMDETGRLFTVEAADMQFGYRQSVFKHEKLTIVNAVFSLQKGEKSEIEKKMQEYICRRKEKQPLEYPSAGSTFKRPAGHFAGALIEKNGLKGLRCGGAAVSEKHAGFIINCGGATCEDVKSLIRRVQETVLQADGVSLEPEVIPVGRE